MARFVTSSFDPETYPIHKFPEFVLIGPSNAGKSTLINALASKKIALISNKPGKTRTINFYEFDNFYLVDTPGYGYARGSKSLVASLSKALDIYFMHREAVEGVFHICSTNSITDKDLEVIEYLTNRFLNYRLLINKVDRLNQSELHFLKQNIFKKISEDKVLFISAKNNLNISKVKNIIYSWL